MTNQFILNGQGKQLILGKATKIMGILNVTPDSFSDGGLYTSVPKALERAKEMVEEGVDIIDVGGESTRPGSKPVLVDEEIKRVIPVIKAIRKSLPKVFISIDSYKTKVVQLSLMEGVDMVNSLGGFLFDEKLPNILVDLGVPIIVYHIKGEPKNMQQGDIRYKNIVGDITDFFKEQINFGGSKGIRRDRFLIDPGIGFGKTVNQNLEIIRRLKYFILLKLPITIGVSRKSHLGKLLQDKLKLPYLPSPTERLEASLAETAVAVFNGAKIVRTHDILETKKFLSVLDRLKNEK